MATSKGGYAKYASHRGPFADAPIEIRLKFWSDDLAYNLKSLEEAKAQGDTRVVKLSAKYIK